MLKFDYLSFSCPYHSNPSPMHNPSPCPSFSPLSLLSKSLPSLPSCLLFFASTHLVPAPCLPSSFPWPLPLLSLSCDLLALASYLNLPPSLASYLNLPSSLLSPSSTPLLSFLSFSFPLTFPPSFLGSGPGGNQRGRSPKEDRGNLYVASVCTSIRPSPPKTGPGLSDAGPGPSETGSSL